MERTQLPRHLKRMQVYLNKEPWWKFWWKHFYHNENSDIKSHLQEDMIMLVFNMAQVFSQILSKIWTPMFQNLSEQKKLYWRIQNQVTHNIIFTSYTKIQVMEQILYMLSTMFVIAMTVLLYYSNARWGFSLKFGT